MFYFNEGVDRNRSESVSESDSDVDGGYTRDGNIFPRNSEHRARAAYLGRETESHFFGSFEEEESEAEDQPGELVQLGLRVNGGRSPKGARPRTHSQQTPTFHDFYNMTRQHLGQGAYGCVSTCVSKTTGKEYAVKIVSKKEESHTRSRILREVNIFNLCRQHPNIVQLIEWFEDEENFYMIFEKMHGGPLLQHILEKGYFTEEEARQVTKDIATALKFLHDKGIAHRDVKPENILCTDANRVSPVKLCDLDLASRAMKNSSPTLPQINSEPDLASPVGSAEFMAPEVVDTFVGDRLKYNFKCDTWSLGVILYIMLCGYAPFQGECDDEECGWMEGQPCDECQKTLFERIQTGKYDFPEEDWSMISPEAKDLVRKLLVKDAKTRYTASDVLKHEWMSLSSRKMSSLLTADNLSKIVKSESSRDVKQIAEHFNVMNRFDGRLSANLGQMSISEEEIADPSVSRASPTKPPPSFVDSFPSHSVPLFMQPPDEFFDSLTGQVICPPSSITSPTSHIWSPMTLSTPKIHNYESTLMFQARPLASSVGLNRIASELETCQNAMARQDSKTDLHQITRETEVQV